MRASSVTSFDTESELHYQGDCKQAVCSTSLSLPRGRAQKTCQLIWLPLLPAIALLVYSSIYLVRDVTDYTTKVGHLHNSRDIEASASCVESIQRIQTLRYTSTLYLGSGSAVHSFERFVDHLFSVEALSVTTATHWEPGQPCNFADIIQKYYSEINFGQVNIYIDDGTLKEFCNLKAFILGTLNQLKNVTVKKEKDAIGRVSSTFNFLIDLMHVDCIKYVAYYDNRIEINKALEQYHDLVDLEKVYSRMLSIGAVYYSRGYLQKSERRAMLANLRLADDYIRFSQHNVSVPDTVRTVIAEVLNADHDRATATSFGLVRWTKVMQEFIRDLDVLVDEQLAEMKGRIDAERSTIDWHVEFAVFAWVAGLCVMLPMTAVNATRTITSIRRYGISCADKELKLKREKHKTDALLQEMLPRLRCSRYCSIPLQHHAFSVYVYMSPKRPDIIARIAVI